MSREPHPTDRRASLVTVTEEGHEVLARWRTGYDELAHRLFGGTPARDLRGFEATLDHVLERLRQPVSG